MNKSRRVDRGEQRVGEWGWSSLQFRTSRQRRELEPTISWWQGRIPRSAHSWILHEASRILCCSLGLQKLTVPNANRYPSLSLVPKFSDKIRSWYGRSAFCWVLVEGTGRALFVVKFGNWISWNNSMIIFQRIRSAWCINTIITTGESFPAPSHPPK